MRCAAIGGLIRVRLRRALEFSEPEPLLRFHITVCLARTSGCTPCTVTRYTVYGICTYSTLAVAFPAILRLPVVTTHACASDLRDECKLEPSIGGAWAEKGDRDNDGKRLAIVRGRGRAVRACVRASRSYLHSGEGEGEGEGEREREGEREN